MNDFSSVYRRQLAEFNAIRTLAGLEPMTLDQYADQGKLFQDQPDPDKIHSNKRQGRDWKDLQTKRQEGFAHTRAPAGHEFDVVTGQRTKPGRFTHKPRHSPGQQSLGLEHPEKPKPAPEAPNPDEVARQQREATNRVRKTTTSGQGLLNMDFDDAKGLHMPDLKPIPKAPPQQPQAAPAPEPSALEHDQISNDLSTMYKDPRHKGGDPQFRNKILDLEKQQEHHRPAAIERAQQEIDAGKAEKQQAAQAEQQAKFDETQTQDDDENADRFTPEHYDAWKESGKSMNNWLEAGGHGKHSKFADDMVGHHGKIHEEERKAELKAGQEAAKADDQPAPEDWKAKWAKRSKAASQGGLFDPPEKPKPKGIWSDPNMQRPGEPDPKTLAELNKVAEEAGLKTSEKEEPGQDYQPAYMEVAKLADNHENYARQTEGGTGLAVGAGHIDGRWKADAIRQMTSDHYKGMPIDEALEKAKGSAREWIDRHNQRRPKDINWKRHEGSADPALDHAARIIRRHGEGMEGKPSIPLFDQEVDDVGELKPKMVDGNQIHDTHTPEELAAPSELEPAIPDDFQGNEGNLHPAQPERRPMTNRRVAASKRALKNERDKSPLFADEIESEQPTPEGRIMDIESGNMERNKEFNKKKSESWQRSLDQIAELPTDEQHRLRDAWNAWSGPKSDEYFAGFVTDWKSGKRSGELMADHSRDWSHVTDPAARVEITKKEQALSRNKEWKAKATDKGTPAEVFESNIADVEKQLDALEKRHPRPADHGEEMNAAEREAGVEESDQTPHQITESMERGIPRNYLPPDSFFQQSKEKEEELAKARDETEPEYHSGDQIKVIGPSADEPGFEEFEYLDGHKKGQTGLRWTKETKDARIAENDKNWKDQQAGFKRVRETAEKKKGIWSDPDTPKPGEFDPASMVTIAADDISKLRSQDVYRLLDNAGDNANEMADYIRKHRPEMGDDIEDAMTDLVDSDNAKDPKPGESMQPAIKKPYQRWPEGGAETTAGNDIKAPGGKITTEGGRQIQWPSKVTGKTYSTPRGQKALNQWLIDEGLKEAKHNGDDWNATIFGGMDVKNLSPSDKDSLNLYLFNDTAPVMDLNEKGLFDNEDAPTETDPDTLGELNKVAEEAGLEPTPRERAQEKFKGNHPDFKPPAKQEPQRTTPMTPEEKEDYKTKSRAETAARIEKDFQNEFAESTDKEIQKELKRLGKMADGIPRDKRGILVKNTNGIPFMNKKALVDHTAKLQELLDSRNATEPDPKIKAQHSAEYKGAFLDNSHGEASKGYPKMLETLRSWSDEQLAKERKDGIKASFGMFGTNAKKSLKLVEQVIDERTELGGKPSSKGETDAKPGTDQGSGEGDGGSSGEAPAGAGPAEVGAESTDGDTGGETAGEDVPSDGDGEVAPDPKSLDDLNAIAKEAGLEPSSEPTDRLDETRKQAVSNLTKKRGKKPSDSDVESEMQSILDDRVSASSSGIRQDLKDEREYADNKTKRQEFVGRHKSSAAANSILVGDVAQVAQDVEHGRLSADEAQKMMADAVESGFTPAGKQSQLATMLGDDQPGLTDTGRIKSSLADMKKAASDELNDEAEKAGIEPTIDTEGQGAALDKGLKELTRPYAHISSESAARGAAKRDWDNNSQARESFADQGEYADALVDKWKEHTKPGPIESETDWRGIQIKQKPKPSTPVMTPRSRSDRAKDRAADIKAKVKSGDTEGILLSMVTLEGLEQIANAKTESIPSIVEQLSKNGVDRSDMRKVIENYRKSQGVEETQRDKDDDRIHVALNSPTPTTDEIKAAIDSIEQHAGGHWRAKSDDRMYFGGSNKKNAVLEAINDSRASLADGAEFKKVRGDYRSFLKSHGTSEAKLMGTGKAKAAKKEAADSISSAPMSLDDYSDFHQRLDNGEVSLDEYKEAYAKFEESRDGIKAELNKMKKAEIVAWHHDPKLERMSFHGGTKAKELENAMDALHSEFDKDPEMLTYGMDGPDKVVAKRIAGTTEEHLKTHAEGVAERRAERSDQLAERKEKFENPQTRQDWSQKRQIKGWHKLTPEEQASHDEAYADERRAGDEKAQAAGWELSLDPEAAGGTSIVEGHHTKHDKPTFTVTVENHLGDRFKEFASTARKLGGRFVNSRTARNYNATEGFQFFDIETAQDFEKMLGGETVDIGDKARAKLEEKASRQTETLSDYSDRLRDKGETSAGQTRMDNTARRARMAASAEGEARDKIAKADTIDKIVMAQSEGTLKHLNGVKFGTHVDRLESTLRGARWDKIRAAQKADPNMSYNAREAMEHAPPSVEDIAHAQFPYPNLWTDHLPSIAGKLKEVPGLKMFGTKIAKMARETRDSSITVTDSRTLEAISKALPRMLHHRDHGVKAAGQMFKDRLEAMTTLRRMDITSGPELRAALREFHSLREQPKGADPVQEAIRTLKRGKDKGFFPTPATLIERMLDHAGIEDGHSILEPSAGVGDIVDHIKERHEDADITAIEQNFSIAEVLGLKGHDYERGDFLEHDKQYDRIVMNPPFENRQDEKHVQHAYSLLKPGGRMVAITGSGAHTNQRSEKFRDWLSEVEADVYDNPEGSFATDEATKKTNVNTKMVIIDKPEGETAKFSADQYGLNVRFDLIATQHRYGLLSQT